MIVFGKNYAYNNTAKSSGESFRYASTNLLAITRNNSAGILDEALNNLAFQSSLLAEKSSTNPWGKFVDIFA